MAAVGVGAEDLRDAVDPGTAEGRVDATGDEVVVEDFLHGVDRGLHATDRSTAACHANSWSYFSAPAWRR